jgi:hypothetical protein
VVRHNVKHHEFVGFVLVFAGFSWMGFAVYGTMLAANRLLLANIPLIAGKELLLFPLFYGIAGLLVTFGFVELRESLPGKGYK